MSTGALTRIQRLAIGKEPTIYDTPASFDQISAIEAVSMTASREALADNRQLTSRKAQHASHLGQKSFEAAFTVPIHEDIHTQLDDVWTAALGSKTSNAPLVFVSGTQSTITVSSGVFDPLILITLSDGSMFVRPVKSVAGGTVATLAIQLPALGGRTVTAVANATACYVQSPSALVDTFTLEMDRDQEPDQVPYIGKGCAVASLGISLDLASRLSAAFSFTGGDWDQSTPSNTADPAEISGQQLGYAAEAFLQDIATPVAGVQIDLNTATLNLASAPIAVRATRACLDNGAIPGSAITHYKRGLFGVDPVGLTLAVADDQYVADRTNKTPKALLMSFCAGGPGDADTYKMAIYYPRLVLDADPTLTDIDGIEGMGLSYRVEEQALTAPYLLQCAVAFFAI